MSVSGTSAGLPVQDVVNWNKQPPKEHKPTFIRESYDNFLIGRLLGKAVQLTTVVGAVKLTYETLAVPAAQFTGSKTVEKCARASVDALGIVTNFPVWAAARTLHYIADTATSYVPNSDSWTGRALKDIVDITGSELANYGTDQINERVTVLRHESLIEAANTQQALLDHQEAVANLQRLEQKNKEVNAINLAANTMVMNAQNNARLVGLDGNKEQIALEASRQVNALSIIDPNPDRNQASFLNKSFKDQVKQVPELLNTIYAENQQALASAAAKVSSSRDSYLNALTSTSFVTDLFMAEARFSFFMQQSTLSVIEVSNKEIDLKEWIQQTYNKNADAAENSPSRKLAIASGMAHDIMLLRQIDDIPSRNYLTHILLEAMDESSRRWSNDVCGKTYEILSGSTTDAFVYKPHGLKKVWQVTAKPGKVVLSWLHKHNADKDAGTLGGQVTSSGVVSATVNGMPVFTVYTPKNSRPSAPRSIGKAPPASDLAQDETEEVVFLPITPLTDDLFYSTLFPLESSYLPAESNVYMGSSAMSSARNSTNIQTFSPTSTSTKPETVVGSKVPLARPKNPRKKPNDTSTAGSVNTLVHEGTKKVIGYSGLGTVGLTLNVMAEFDKGYGFAIGAWNVAFQAAVGSNRYTATLAASSNLYAQHVSQASVNNFTNILWHQGADFREQGNHEASTDIMMSIGLLKSVDVVLRKTNDAFQAPMLTPEKVAQIQQQARNQVSLIFQKSTAAQSALEKRAEACGKTRMQQAQKRTFEAAANALAKVNEQLDQLKNPTKGKGKIVVHNKNN